MVFVAQLATGLALAQTAEYERGSGGQIEMMTKEATKRLSGSLSMSQGRSSAGLGSLKGFEGTLGGTIVEDRLWFFAAAARNESLAFVPGLSELPQPVATNAVDAKVMANLGNRHDFSAAFSTGRDAITTSAPMTFGTVPTSFLSLRYTGIVSSNMFFDVNVSQRSIGRQGL